MIRSVSSPRLTDLIHKVVNNDDLIGMKPVFAGSFALSMYRAYRLYDTEEKWKELKRSFDHGILTKRIDTFGDIDFWFTEDSPVHNNGYGSWIIKDENSASSEFFRSPPFGERYRIVRTSKWANSFRVRTEFQGQNSSSSHIFQPIKRPIASVDDLFESFDFINSCAAFYDGKLYYDHKLDLAFNSFELRVNNNSNYKVDSVPSRVYSSLRAFKYAKRYLLDFSPELSEYVFQTYYDLCNVDHGLYGNYVSLKNNVYGPHIISDSDYNSMVFNFKTLFKDFIKMKTFKEEYALFLINSSGLSGLKEYIANNGTIKEEANPNLCLPF